MFDTVVWATDGSPCADNALSQVRELCERYSSSLLLVHIVQKIGGGYVPAPDARPDEDRVIAKLKAQTHSLRRHGVDASLHVVRGATGSPATHIAAAARAVDADLVIVGTLGCSPLRAALLGGVTLRLLAAATCPVLVLPPPTIRLTPPSWGTDPGAVAAPDTWSRSSADRLHAPSR
jgi:nucleotide-binding universal stress UspA family protein